MEPRRPISQLPPAGPIAGGDVMVLVQGMGTASPSTRRVSFSEVAAALPRRLGCIGQAPLAPDGGQIGVISVAGKNGVVTLQVPDVDGLLAALDAKAAAAHRHTVAEVEGVQSLYIDAGNF